MKNKDNQKLEERIIELESIIQQLKNENNLLKKSEIDVQQATDIFENIQTGIYIYELENPDNDSSLRMIAANPASEVLTGVKTVEIVGKRIDEIFPALREKGIIKKYYEVIRFKKKFEIDDFLYSDNRISEDSFSIKAFSLPNNRIGIAFENIKERKKALEELRKSEERYRLLFDSAADAIFMMKNDKFIDCNKATLELFGCSWEKIINCTPFSFSPEKQPDGSDSITKGLEKIKDALSGKPQIFEWQHRKCDGTLFDAEISLLSFTILNEVFLQAFVRDITSRKLVQKSLIESEMKFRNIFNSTTDGIIIIAFNGKIIESNDIFIYNTGYSKEDIQNMTFNDFSEPAFHSVLKEKTGLLVEKSKIPPFEIEIRNKDNSLSPVEISCIIIDYNDAKAILAIIRDIQDRKLVEKKILDAIIKTEEKEREKFAKNLHDDLGPLLSSIKMYVNSIYNITDLGKQKFVIDQLNDIVREAIQSTKEISNDLSPHVLKNYGLTASIQSFARNVEEHIRIKFETNLNDNRLSDEVETSVYRIIKELINNTIKHAGASEVVMKLVHDKKKLILLFKDNGIGFEHHIDDIKENGGMGISNIISRIRSLKGKYSFKSEKNSGITFELQIPL